MDVYAGTGQGKRVVRGIFEAEYSIKILCYLFLSPRSHTQEGISTSIYNILNKKIANAVTVQILSNDKFPTGWLKKKVEIERERLRKIGAIVRTYPRKNILHSKLILIDQKKAFFGSMNLTADSMNKNHELLAVITETETIKKLNKIFLTAWNTAGEKN